jgi:colanic acid/amylovoran biosynthesis glycosyltransferase
MEGQALVIQEAQAKGLPVISTYHDGIPEGVLEGKTAKLVPERSVKGLISSIKHFIGGGQLERYSRCAERFIHNKFDNKHLLDRQVEIYRNLRAGEVEF